MRWFVVFLLLANLVLFFWSQQQAQRDAGSISLAPPDVGHLQLSAERAEPAVAVSSESAAPAGDPSAAPIAAPELTASQTPAVGREAAPDRLPRVVVAQPSGETMTRPERLEQSSSLAASPAAAETLTAPEMPEQNTPAICVRMGPFRPADADTLLANLPAYLGLLSDTSEEYRHTDGYYVLIPALESRSAGIRKLEELREAGVRDTWLFPRGELRNAISLGLFSRRVTAERHAANMAAKGFDTLVQPKTSLREQRWLKLQRADGGDFDGTLPLPDGVSLARQSCP